MKRKVKRSGNLVTRRDFISKSAAAAAGITIVPGRVVAGLGHVPPSDKLNIAAIGIGGKGVHNIRHMVEQNIVALCDVDWDYAAKVFEEYPDAKRYKDYRVMLEEQKDIDAVVIATPDHTHAIQAMDCMELGKHVYLQKPLTHSVWESRQMTLAARKYGVATQMGNEGHSSDNVRKVAEILWNGTIGAVTEVHAWTNRPIWPQGLDRPDGKVDVPETLSWDLFLGPAPERAYHPAYTPWNWRAWWDFGTGALGDMGCHVLDVPFYAMNLKYPVAVQASSSKCNTESAPVASRVEYVFPAREKMHKLDMPEVTLTWHDGGMMPSRPEELPDGVQMGSWGGGNLFIGSRGKLICNNYGGNYKLLPDGLDTDAPARVERIPDDPLGGERHEMEWVRACKQEGDGRKNTCSNFDYSGPLSEMVLMGNLAIRLQGLHRQLDWDGDKMELTNIGEDEKISLLTTYDDPEAKEQPGYKTDWGEFNALESAREWIRHTYRDGWEMNEV